MRKSCSFFLTYRFPFPSTPHALQRSKHSIALQTCRMFSYFHKNKYVNFLVLGKYSSFWYRKKTVCSVKQNKALLLIVGQIIAESNHIHKLEHFTKKRSYAADNSCHKMDFDRDRPTWISIESGRLTYLSHWRFWASIWSAWRTWTREAASLLPRTIDGWSFLQKALEKYQTEAPTASTWKTQSCEWH